MRKEHEMYKLILDTALADERILAVYMNGSRVNEKAARDIFQDYDIVYVVRQTEPFIEQRDWIDIFGDRLYMQCPEEMNRILLKESDIHNCYGWLMQLSDGNRIDLHVQSVPYAKKAILTDKLCRILLDKEDILPDIPPSTDEDYYVRKPSETEFLCVCNEFWWCLNNVAKGLFRKEATYVQDMLNGVIRPQLMQLLAWKTGIITGFSCSVGKSGKYMNRYLPKEVWDTYLNTYCSGKIQEMWVSVFCMCALFSQTAHEVCKELDFSYDEPEEENSLGFLKHVRELPENVQEIY